MKTKHTPGPWKAYNQSGRILSKWHIGSDNGDIAHVLSRNDADRHNAALIASSPELLAALQDLLKVCDSFIACPQIDAARQAIQKAQGGA